MDKKARLELFYERLKAAPAAKDHDTAYALICTELDAVEDKHSGVANHPENWETDGRMYPPQPDSVRKVVDFPEVVRYRHLNHNTFIATNGAIEVQRVDTKEVQFAKPGANGKGVWDAQDPAKK